jgi:pimeloyl-ACP methyl ester carboxylesterase
VVRANALGRRRLTARLYLPSSVITMKPSYDVPMRTGRLKLPVGSLYWHEAGKGEVVVCLHGSWHDSTQWLPVIQELATGYHCLAPDLVGFGESSRASTPHSIALEVEALQGLLTALRIHQCRLVGHSLGAWVALQYALSYPSQVQGLVLIEPEGWAHQHPPGHWRLDRWLTAPLATLLLSATAPLLAGLGWKTQVNRWRRRQQTLRQSPAACQILFRRRAAAIAAEHISPQALPAHLPVLELPSSATATTALGVETSAIATALRTITPQRPGPLTPLNR